MTRVIQQFCILIFTVLAISVAHAQEIAPGVRFIRGATNGLSVQQDGSTLVVYGDPGRTIKNAEFVLLTDFRRDVIWSGLPLIQAGAKVIAPLAQKPYFAATDSLWSTIADTQFRERTNRTTKIATSNIEVSRFVQGNDVIHWKQIDFRIINSTGFTRGAVSYIFEIDKRKIACTGDLIYQDGKLFDLYSFQDSLKGGIDGNHGYAVRLGQLLKSLESLARENPDVIVPLRGPVIHDPRRAIQKLTERIHAFYSNYLSITAQRWNHTDRMTTLSNHVLGAPNAVEWMPFSEVITEPPPWYKHINCSNLVIAEDSTAFMIDCGTRNDLEAVKKMKQSGRIKRVDGIFITHYHFDHTDFVNAAKKEFDCPVYVTRELEGILKNPGAYHMPSMTPEPIYDLTIVKEGQKMLWKEFILTFFFFPGQTLYHDALLIEKTAGESVFFTGDSFTPAGIDDYCFQNRNQLTETTGFLYCLDVLMQLPPNVLLSNQHITPLFRFSPRQLEHMKHVLLERNTLIKDMLLWDNVNYGTDDQWAWMYPYKQKVRPGQTVSCTARIHNYSDVARTFYIKPNMPEGVVADARFTPLVVSPNSEGEFTFRAKVSKRVRPGISVVTMDIKFDDWALHEWTECILEIKP